MPKSSIFPLEAPSRNQRTNDYSPLNPKSYFSIPALRQKTSRDNQGVRYILINWLLTLTDVAGVKKLFKKYRDDGMAEWGYSRVLLALLTDGPGKKAETELKKALKANARVLTYLKNQKLLPRETPDSYSLGSDEEAVIYVEQSLEAWKATPGALAWIKNQG